MGYSVFMNRILMAAGIACLVLATPGAASAQSSTPPLSVEEIQYCTCLQERIESMRPEMEARQAMVQERQRTLSAIEAEISNLQNTMDPDDQLMQEQLKSKIYKANQIRDLIRQDLGPAEMSTAHNFNQSVRSYNETCANRRMINVDIVAAQSTLDCSAMQLP
jgi:Skp family chaperone for outer membrane proteins